MNNWRKLSAKSVSEYLLVKYDTYGGWIYTDLDYLDH